MLTTWMGLPMTTLMGLLSGMTVGIPHSVFPQKSGTVNPNRLWYTRWTRKARLPGFIFSKLYISLSPKDRTGTRDAPRAKASLTKPRLDRILTFMVPGKASMDSLAPPGMMRMLSPRSRARRHEFHDTVNEPMFLFTSLNTGTRLLKLISVASLVLTASLLTAPSLTQPFVAAAATTHFSLLV